jgi:hypothetical protein
MVPGFAADRSARAVTAELAAATGVADALVPSVWVTVLVDEVLRRSIGLRVPPAR